MNTQMTGTWDIIIKDDILLLFLILRGSKSLEIILGKQDSIFIENFLLPGSKHTYVTTTKMENEKVYVTLFSNKECIVETL